MGAYSTAATTSAYPSPPSYPGYPAYTPAATTSGPPVAATTTATQQQQPLQRASTLSDEQIRASLLSAVEDKMRRRLRELFTQAQAELDTLQRTNDDLTAGKTQLDAMMERMAREQAEVEASLATLQQKDAEIRETLAKMEGQEELDIDEVVVPTAPLYRQILECFSEEQATEDAIYYLTEGLKRQVIDLDTYLKQVRELSRRQFQCRALVQRCRQKAGLPEVQ